MTGIANKLIVGTIATGALGGGAYGVYALTDTTDSIENYLKKNNLDIVSQDATSETAWNKAFGTYEIEKEEDDLKITDKEIKNRDDIKKWCNNTLRKKIKSTENSLYKKASYWCTKYQTISEKLGNDKPFETNVATLEGKHAQLGVFKNTIESITLRKTKQENQNGEKMKQWCDDNKKRKFNKRNKSFIDNITSHCLVKATTISV
ncbi:hypothetical protein A6V39_03940 [Candidatus Mycoplasma haematobovis]|uniref:Uncharacterized protein n=1 Tax=Candidatus Mycoplasma haematobovis TaxID=432608 RepID=A0A1A9QEA8_9MOLU|nr:hypothetical protein [Candidatus Mycoplasma haematobovis]OAL10039.1 hypothetical protein A6V39_03940 [Candidatus Mycoplasma haematobovis]